MAIALASDSSTLESGDFNLILPTVNLAANITLITNGDYDFIQAAPAPDTWTDQGDNNSVWTIQN